MFLFVVLMLFGCEAIDDARNELTYDDLMEGFQAQKPVSEASLTIPQDAMPPKHIFEGRLELLGEADNGQIKRIEGAETVPSHLPEFNFTFVQQDSYLVPVERGLIITANEDWNYFLEPGRVWYESQDGEFSRASFPFALSWKGSNAIHNGTMSFLFNNSEVSRVWYQVTQETTIDVSVDLWGLLEAEYYPEKIENAQEIRNAFLGELSDRFPNKPMVALEKDFPGIDTTAFGDGVSPEAMTWYGFVINGVNYLGGCQTRYGIYPYCEYMRAPSYSTAKSAFASLALMRLAQKYDPMVGKSRIIDYVPEAKDSIGDWSAVTFDQTLDMATGNFRTSERMVDEEHWDTDPFWAELDYEPRIKAAFNWPQGAPPGTTWVYRTFDTFIVTRAMQNYLVTREGADADIFNFVVEEIYQPLGMGPGVFSTLRTRDDNWQGQPYGGYGLWWIPDDLAKISTFLNVDHGQIDGIQVLNPDMLDDALQRDPSDRGVIRDGVGRYNNAFWADQYISEEDNGCSFWVVNMYGYSGIVVTLMPNGTTYYYASDNQEFSTYEAIQESDKLVSMCGK